MNRLAFVRQSRYYSRKGSRQIEGKIIYGQIIDCQGVLGLFEGPQEMVVSADNSLPVAIRHSDRLCGRLCSRTVYLYADLTHNLYRTIGNTY